MPYRIAVVALFVLSLNFLWAAPLAAEESSVYTDRWLDQRYDWVMYIEASNLTNYLNYKNSELTPLTDLKVSYRINPRLAPKNPAKLPYEDLWYHSQSPVGCRRFSDLALNQGWQGAVCFQNSGDNSNTDALADAVVRLVLDAALKGGVANWVLVPPYMVPAVTSALGRFDFRKSTEQMIMATNGVFLVVSSGADRDRQFLLYHPQL